MDYQKKCELLKFEVVMLKKKVESRDSLIDFCNILVKRQLSIIAFAGDFLNNIDVAEHNQRVEDYLNKRLLMIAYEDAQEWPELETLDQAKVDQSVENIKKAIKKRSHIRESIKNRPLTDG